MSIESEDEELSNDELEPQTGILVNSSGERVDYMNRVEHWPNYNISDERLVGRAAFARARESEVARRRRAAVARESQTTFEMLPWDMMTLVLDKVPGEETDKCLAVCRRWCTYLRHNQRSLRLENPGESFFPLRKKSFFNLLSLTLDFSLSDPPVPGQTTSTMNGDVVQLVTDQDLATVAIDCPMLERLQLFCCDLVTATGLTQLARGCRGLEFIHLTHCRNFDDAGMLAVVSACERLQHLQISYCEITAAGIEALSKLTTVSAYACPRSLHQD